MRTGPVSRRALQIFGAGFVVLTAVVVARTARFPSRQVPAAPAPAIELDASAAAHRLGQAIRHRTVSQPELGDPAEFVALRAFLEDAFPLVHSRLEREAVGRGLLFTWRGREAGARPLVLMAHLDVAPVEPGTETRWTHPPFSGMVADGFVWGRGALDDKGPALSLLEAAEHLLRDGFEPRRTVLIAFGEDEEVGGFEGAARIAATLRERHVTPEFVLDEGLPITEGVVPGVAAPLALVGLAEKGYLSLELTVETPGGHSSMPPPETAVGILAAALHRLERHPMPTRFSGPVRALFEHAGPEMSWPLRAVAANLWLLRLPLERRLLASPGTAALLRTTTALTMVQGGVKDNELPQQARGIANFRIVPGDSIAAVEAHARRVVADPRVRIGRFGEQRSEPSPVSEVNTAGYRSIARSVREVL
ncbi:MAG: M20/M25/M40 family metallo-hydrolase, partial [Candidatus Rokubacteria bacterium]|nr:M20/M25/M40 family metallo-hydrolase [Candidatus Rokubacteria bacterium]